MRNHDITDALFLISTVSDRSIKQAVVVEVVAAIVIFIASCTVVTTSSDYLVTT